MNLDYDELTKAVRRILPSSAAESDIELEAVPGGANNRAFKVTSAQGCFLLKVYYQNPDDPRSRRAAEFAFSVFLWRNGIRCIGEPVAEDPERNMALYGFLPGRKPSPGALSAAHVHQALGFFTEINRLKHLPEAAALPDVSEACFSLSEHLACVERRISRLQSVPEAGVSGFHDLVQDEMPRCWARVKENTILGAQRLGIGLEARLPGERRCLSPSDFGFHNALIDDRGAVRFIDFEYAGWDDPAKSLNDFFCQPEVPVPLEFYDIFLRAALAGHPEPQIEEHRLRGLLPVYQIKWCCILLNEFLPADGRRREFALDGAGAEARKAGQLLKARRLLDLVGKDKDF